MAVIKNPRCFKFFSVGTTAQPLIGTTLTNNIGACSPNSTASGVGGQTAVVGDSSMFLPGDFAKIIPAVGNTTPTEEHQVQITAVVNTTTVVMFNSAPHNANDLVVLFWPCAYVRVQEQKSAPAGSNLFLGVSASLTTAGVWAFTDLSVDFTFVPPYRTTNSDNAENYWIISASGTVNYLPSLWVI